VIETLRALYEMGGLARRNPAFVASDVRRSWAVVKTMRQFRLDNPTSPWSGKPVKEVHHVVPVAVGIRLGHPEWAADPANMVAMGSRNEHYILGHMNKSWRAWNSNLRETIGQGRVAEWATLKEIATLESSDPE